MPMILGKTKCMICEESIKETDQYINFPPFISNRLDPLAFANDASFHKVCFWGHPLSTEVIRRWDFKNRYIKAKDYHTCVVCQQKITGPSDYFSLVDFSDDPNNSLYEYNYLEFHRSHLHQWTELDTFIHHIKTLNNQGTWDDIGLNGLLKEMGEILGENE